MATFKRALFVLSVLTGVIQAQAPEQRIATLEREVAGAQGGRAASQSYGGSIDRKAACCADYPFGSTVAELTRAGGV